MKHKEEVLSNDIGMSVAAVALYLQYIEALLSKHTASIRLAISLLNSVGNKPEIFIFVHDISLPVEGY
jgi:hypothetical protein